MVFIILDEKTGGMVFIGPFKNSEAARDYAKDNYNGRSWRLLDMHKPAPC